MGLLPTKIKDSEFNIDWQLNRELDGVKEPFQFEFQLKEMELPHNLAQPFWKKLESLQLVGKLTGPLMSGLGASALEGWRDAGGTIEITKFARPPAKGVLDPTSFF